MPRKSQPPRASFRKVRNRKAEGRRSSPALSHDSHGIYLAKHPLSDVEPSERRRNLISAGQKAILTKEAAKAELTSLMEVANPLHVLSNVALVATTRSVGSIEDLGSQMDRHGLRQQHVEIAQAFALAIPSPSAKPARPGHIQAVIDCLKSLAESSLESRFEQLDENITDEELRRLDLRERLRTHTEAIRNWGYFCHVLDILMRLYAPIDGLFERHAGVKATTLICCFKSFIELIERRASSYMSRLANSLVGKSRREMVNAYVREFSLEHEQAGEIWKYMQENRIPKKGIISILMSHSGFFVPDIFTFSSAGIAAELEIEVHQLDIALTRLSLNFGELKDCNVERFLLANPVWGKPLIQIGESKFFCPIPPLFFDQAFSILAGLIADDNVARRCLEARRAEFLEGEVERIFRSSFDGAEIETNVRWRLGEQRFETDLLVRVDSQLFIVEAKSHTISAAALRGADKRAARHVKEMLNHPAEQSARLAGVLAQWNSSAVERFDFEINTSIDLEKVSRIHRISVTLEDFATLQSHMVELNKLMGKEIEQHYPVTLTLPDLMAVCEILEEPWEKIHYFTRRSEIQQSVRYVADELDLLGVYLRSGFALGKFEGGEEGLIATGMSADVDTFFNGRYAGVESPKPRRNYEPWFRDIVNRFYQRRMPGWTEAVIPLLSLDEEDQREAIGGFERLKRELARSSQPTSEVQNVLVSQPRGFKRDSYAFVALRDFEKADRARIMNNAAQVAFERTTADHCIVIAQDVHDKDYPYTSFLIAVRPNN